MYRLKYPRWPCRANVVRGAAATIRRSRVLQRRIIGGLMLLQREDQSRISGSSLRIDLASG
jgi:hypothetical protein